MEGNLALVNCHLAIHLLIQVEVFLGQAGKNFDFTCGNAFIGMRLLVNHFSVWAFFILLVELFAMKVILVGL